MSDHLTTALIILLASLPVTLPAAVLVLRWGFRDDGRPPGYRPRHRRPWRPWRRRKTAVHVGATLDQTPGGDIARTEADEPLTPTELLPSHVVRSEVRVPDTDALADDVHHALDTIDDAVADFGERIDALLAGFLAQPVPYCVDRGAARARAAWAEQTGPWSTAELHQLLDREGLVRT